VILLHASKLGGSSHLIKVGMTIMSYYARALVVICCVSSL